MTDTPTTGAKMRDQETGTNLSTWGDNTDANLAILDRKLTNLETYVVSLTSQTVTYTDYSSSNPMLSANVILTGNSGVGTLTSDATITMPSVRGDWNIFNRTGSSIVFGTATGVQVTVPYPAVAHIGSNGTDFYHLSPTYTPNYANPLVNSGDLVSKYTLEAAIATASLPATAGTILAGASDTTAGYAGTKIVGAGAASVSVTGSGNQSVTISVGGLGLTAGTAQTVGFTAAVNTKYVCNFTAAATITLPASATAGDVISLGLAGGFGVTLNPNGLKLNASTSTLGIGPDMQTIFLTYTGATNGWV